MPFGLDTAHQLHSMSRKLAAANACAYCPPLRGWKKSSSKKALVESLRLITFAQRWTIHSCAHPQKSEGQFVHTLVFLCTDGDRTCSGVWAGFLSGTFCPGAASHPRHFQLLQQSEKTWRAPWKNDYGTAGCHRGWGAPWQNGTLHTRFKSTTLHETKV